MYDCTEAEEHVTTWGGGGNNWATWDFAKFYIAMYNVSTPIGLYSENKLYNYVTGAWLSTCILNTLIPS